MDDNNFFRDVMNNVLGVATTLTFNEILGFANNFSALMSVIDQ